MPKTLCCALVVAAVGAFAALCLPAAVQAHGDPVSEVLLVRDLFLPLHMKRDSDAARQLGAVVRAANEAGFRLKVAVVAEPSDLGPRAWLYHLPQRFAGFLSNDVAAEDGVLVVMPNGFGYAIDGRQVERSRRALASVRRPGRDAEQEARAASLAVRRLAATRGFALAPTTSSGGSETRDRVIIAAAAAAAAGLLAGGMIYRRKRRTLKA